MAFDELLRQRATLQQGILGHTSTGDETVSWMTVAEGIPVLVRPVRFPADLRPGEQETVTHVIFTRPIADVQDAPTAPWQMIVRGQTFLLIEPGDAAARGHHLEIRARRLL